MLISYKWLKKHIDLQISPEEVAEKLTKGGLEVEGLEEVESIKGGLKGFVVGEVLTCEKHPDADKLSKTTVDVGTGETLSVVCGAPNVAAGQKVIVATVGTEVYLKDGSSFKIKKSKIRGEVSEGMICAEDELGLGEGHDGIMVLDANAVVGTAAAAYFNIESDFVFEIGLTPNRADAASHLGVARDLAALLESPVLTEKFDIPTNGLKPFAIEVENKEACPQYCGVVIKGVTVKDSPDWLKNALNAIGITPKNNVVDITNYILHDLGQPLHAFDMKAVGEKVVVKTGLAEVKFKTLDEVDRKLYANDLMICNANAPMCIAGVFGGIDSGVSANTVDVFIESAYFNPDFIRKTAQLHGLKTDASFRFERGTDPNMPMFALKKATQLILDLAGGTLASDFTLAGQAKFDEFEINTSYTYINELIGESIAQAKVKSIITNLGMMITEKGDEIKVSVPPFKVDVQRPADIVEEVLRIYGYDNIPLAENLKAGYIANFPSKDKDKLQGLVGRLLADNGFQEIITNSLTKPAYNQIISSENDSVEVLNKLSEDLAVLRNSLLYTGLDVLAYNINRRQKDLKLFEFGKTYFKTADGYDEKNKLALFLTGAKFSETWIQKTQSIDYYNAKSVVGKILSKLQVKVKAFQDTQNTLFAYGTDVILNNNQVLATFGLLLPKNSKVSGVKQPVMYIEFDADALLKAYQNKILFKDLNKFPEVRRDLSIVIDKKVSFEQIQAIANKVEKKLISDIQVFDIYEGENLGENKKSYSVSYILEDMEKTLTDEVIDKIMNKLIDTYQNELGAVIRK